MRSRWRPALFALYLLALVGLAEFALRTLGVVATWRENNRGDYVSPYKNRDSWLHVMPANEVSSFGQPEFDFEIVTNSLGLRDVEHPLAKAANEFRIVALGDSFTAGHGAAFEDTWLQQLARELRKGPPASGMRITPISGGVGGSDPFFGYVLLEQRLLAYDPDLVILATNKSDVFDVVVRGGMERFRPDGTVRAEAPKIEWLFGRSHLARAILMGVFGYDWSLLRRDEAATKHAEALTQISDLAAQLEELGRAEGFDLLVVVHPSKPPLPEPGSGIASLAAPLGAAGVDVLDLIEYFRAEIGDTDPEHRYFWRLDRHNTPEGYGIFARGVAEKIRAEGYLLERSAD